MHAFLSMLDYNLFVLLNSWTSLNFIDWFFVICAVYFAYLMPAILLGWWFAAKDRLIARKAIILATISAAFAREVVKTVIAAFWSRNRPFIAHQVHDLISKTDNQASFPSGHAIAMFAIAPVIYHYNKKLGWAMYVMSALTAVSRVVVGVHYPSDVIAGAILGVLVGWLTVKILDLRIEPLARWFSNVSDRILPFTRAK